MTRELKFRALAKDGTWRYGEYPHSAPEMSNTHYPLDVFWWQFLTNLRRETLGQYTGLKVIPLNKEIYEGDILRPVGYTASYFRRVVEYKDGGFGYKDNSGSWQHLCSDNVAIYDIIGNLYENPDLVGR